MRKILINMAILAVISITASCEKELGGLSSFGISAEICDDYHSKVSYADDDANNIIKLQWESNDAITLFWKDESENLQSVSCSIHSESISNNGKNATFKMSEEKSIKDETEIYAVYAPGRDLSGVNIDNLNNLVIPAIDLSSQTGGLSTIHNVMILCAKSRLSGEIIRLQFRNAFSLFGFNNIGGLKASHQYKFSMMSQSLYNKGTILYDGSNSTFTKSDDASNLISVSAASNEEGKTGKMFFAVPNGISLSTMKFEVVDAETDKAVFMANTIISDGTQATSAGTCYMKKTELRISNPYALPGVFSVSEDKQVRFSPGNLQYQASSKKWRFATNQWDYIGEGSNNNGLYSSETVFNADGTTLSTNLIEANNRPYYSGWIDLFFFGATGRYNTSNTNTPQYYMPYEYNTFSNLFQPNSLGLFDWGNNAIDNGGQVENMWFTLSKSEWEYLLDKTKSNRNYAYTPARVKIEDDKYVLGIMLFPDNWDGENWPSGGGNNPGNPNDNYNKISVYGSETENQWTFEQLQLLEKFGVVFLPQIGGMYSMADNRFAYLNDKGRKSGGYWTSDKSQALVFTISTDNQDSYNIGVIGTNNPNRGYAVRLATNAIQANIIEDLVFELW